MINLNYKLIECAKKVTFLENKECSLTQHMIKFNKVKDVYNLVDMSMFIECFLKDLVAYDLNNEILLKAIACVKVLNKDIINLRDTKILHYKALIGLKANVVNTNKALHMLESHLLVNSNFNSDNELDALYTIQGYNNILKEFLLSLRVIEHFTKDYIYKVDC